MFYLTNKQIITILHINGSLISTNDHAFLHSCLNPLSNEQIRRFTCCLNMGLNLKILKISPELFACNADQADRFPNVFVCENVCTAMTL